MKKFFILNRLAKLFKIDFYKKNCDASFEKTYSELECLAGLDSLTQLPNRYLFQNMLANSLVFSKKNKNTLALLHFHVDNFKSINDSFGYKLGDVFLKKIVGRLRECIDKKNSISRLCSVEFCIILEDIKNTNEIIDIAFGISENFKRPIIHEEKEIIFSVSIGIAVSDGESSVECMMQYASNALQQAKESRSGYKFYNKAMAEKPKNCAIFARHLRNAIQENQFELYYQPKVNAENHMLVGIEALVRWNNPLLKNPSPAEFIPVAEETGLINSLGVWIIKTALLQYDAWYNKTNKMQNVKIAINLSPLQLSDNLFIETIVDTLTKTKIPTANILFEITETALMKKALDIKSLAQTFLMELGIGFAIDDFGTGYSSLTYLKELPVKELKIDKSFIDDIGINNNSESIIKAMINLGKTLGLDVVAEGVETKKQLDFLLANQCQTIQGHFFSKPLSLADMTSYIESMVLNFYDAFHIAKQDETNIHKQEFGLRIPVRPDNEAERVKTLHALNILDTPPEERFDRITRLAKKLFDVSIALVSLVDTERQWLKSKQGLDINEIPRDVSFCSHAILTENILVVNNALQDERFRYNPLVAGNPQIRFYAGCPIAAANDFRLGTLCLIDKQPRDFNEEQRALLRDLAKIVEDEIDTLRLTNTDELTGLSNRRGFLQLANYTVSLCTRLEKTISIFALDLDDFKLINDAYGHAAGDEALKQFTKILQVTFRDSDVIARMGGDEFAILASNVKPETAEQVAQRLHQSVEAYNATSNQPFKINYSMGQSSFYPEHPRAVAELLNEADLQMYANKRQEKKR